MLFLVMDLLLSGMGNTGHVIIWEIVDPIVTVFWADWLNFAGSISLSIWSRGSSFKSSLSSFRSLGLGGGFSCLPLLLCLLGLSFLSGLLSFLLLNIFTTGGSSSLSICWVLKVSRVWLRCSFSSPFVHLWHELVGEFPNVGSNFFISNILIFWFSSSNWLLLFSIFLFLFLIFLLFFVLFLMMFFVVMVFLWFMFCLN